MAEDVICNEKEAKKVALTLSETKEVCVVDTEPLSNSLAEVESDNVAVVVEDIDVHGEVETVTDTDALCEIEADDEILEVSDGLFEEDTEVVGVVLSVINAVAVSEDW